MPSSQRVLKHFGANIKLARLRRRLQAGVVAMRADITRRTLWQIENGAPSVAMGTYCKVLFVLGLEQDLLKVAADDALGRKLQDAELTTRERAPRKNK